MTGAGAAGVPPAGGAAPAGPPEPIPLSQVLSALSYALDITEGQPEGHAVRTCLIGMRIAAGLGLPSPQRSALFYALLLKDLGCSSNAARVASLFGSDDRAVKKDLKTTDWPRWLEAARYVMRNAAPGAAPLERAMRVLAIGLRGQRGARQLTELRCERGAEVARLIGFPEETAEAIRAIDEHWNGRGHPAGLKGERIPLLARITGLAQTVEVFIGGHGLEAARSMARARRGRWFDPDLVDRFLAIPAGDRLWQRLRAPDVRADLAEVEPADQVLLADEARLDRVAEAFARIVDAKSPWTYHHSRGVAEIAAGVGQVLGLPAADVAGLRRAALLHDIGKLGVSNRVLDKPGPLTDLERVEIRRHVEYTQRLLGRVPRFADVADLASGHHERMDGQGYFRGLSAHDLTVPARILTVADIFEALSADRPYRRGLPEAEVLAVMGSDVGTRVCPDCFEALRAFLARAPFVPYGRRQPREAP
jgi:putative nucleotidyltransferase with HDIG domain